MLNKLPKIISFVLQGSYSAVSLFFVLVCLVFQSMESIKMINLFLLIMELTLLLLIFLFFTLLPLSFVINTHNAISSFRDKSRWRIFWIVWTLISPIIYFVFFALSGGTFVGVTGGV